MIDKIIVKYFSGLTRDTLFLAFVSLFADISTEMLYPVLPVFLVQNLRTSGSVVGLIEGFAQATVYIVQGFSGTISDQLQKRKMVSLVGYTLGAISKPFIGLSTIWQQVFFARLFDRMGSGIRSAPRDALIASSVDEVYRGKAFGLEGIGDNLGAFIGPILTIFLLFYFQLNIRHIFYLAIIPGIIAVFLMMLIHEKKVEIANEKVRLTFKNFSREYWNYLLVTLVFGLGAFSNAFLILQTKSIGVSLEITILIYAAFNLVAALASYPSGLLSDKFGRKNILLIAFVIFLVTCVGFASTTNYLFVGLLFVFYGCFQGIYRTVGKSLAVDLTPANLRASGIGWYSTTVGISSLIASLIAGQLWDRFGRQSIFVYGAFFATLGIFLLIFFVKQTHSKPLPAAV